MDEQPEQELPPMGRLAFEQWTESMEGMMPTFGGKQGIPPWDALDDKQQHAWDQAARRLYVLGFTAGSKLPTLFGKDMTPQQRALLDTAIAYAAGEGRVDELYDAVDALEAAPEPEQPEVSHPMVTVILRPLGVVDLAYSVVHQVHAVANSGQRYAVPGLNLSVEVHQ